MEFSDVHQVDIVLATYNGEKFLSEQIDSIIAQDYKNWRLLISDDGSKDRTVKIAENYCNIDNRIILVNKDRQGGVVKNFSKALEFVTSEYIMFCDQDDYWLPGKITHLKKLLMEKEVVVGKVPLLIFSDLIIVDEALKITNKSFFHGSNINPKDNFNPQFLLWRSAVYGCTVMFNKSLYDVAMPLPSEVTMHDQWFALKASLMGFVMYSNESHVYYRQHGNNVVGAKNKSLFEKIIGSFKTIGKIKNAACLTNKMAIFIFGEQEKKIEAKLKFIFVNVIPYFKSGKIYILFFTFFYLLSGDDK